MRRRRGLASFSFWVWAVTALGSAGISLVNGGCAADSLEGGGGDTFGDRNNPEASLPVDAADAADGESDAKTVIPDATDQDVKDSAPLGDAANG